MHAFCDYAKWFYIGYAWVKWQVSFSYPNLVICFETEVGNSSSVPCACVLPYIRHGGNSRPQLLLLFLPWHTESASTQTERERKHYSNTSVAVACCCHFGCCQHSHGPFFKGPASLPSFKWFETRDSRPILLQCSHPMITKPLQAISSRQATTNKKQGTLTYLNMSGCVTTGQQYRHLQTRRLR